MRIKYFIIHLFLLNCNNYCYSQKSVSVNTTSGKINGKKQIVVSNEVNVFLGVPYAQPPIGELRFKKPLPLKNQFDSYDASEWPNPCMQTPANDKFFLNKNYSEDCLYLNIWSPTDIETDELKAVMFWIHGGGLHYGSASEYIYSGEVLSTKGDVVVVTINYRLNVFGFFYSGTDDAPGNVGLWDQALALEWVNDNIRYFGGDPQRITIFGESAGSWSVSLHLLSPITRNLYQNAIMMSGAVVSSEFIDESIVSKTKWLNGAKLIGCDDENIDNEFTTSTIKCLQNIDTSSLLKITKIKEMGVERQLMRTPVIDGEIVTNTPNYLLKTGDHKKRVNLLIGTTEDEGSFLLAYRVNRTQYHPSSPQNLSYFEAYQQLDNIISGNLFRVPINGEEVAKLYFEPLSTHTNDSDLLRRTIGIAVGDYYLGCQTAYFAKYLYKNDRKRTNVYQYHYNTKFSEKFFCSEWMGACHADDIWPVFGVPFIKYERSTDEERAQSLRVIDLFAHFAKYGYPSPQNGKDWPKYYSLRNDNEMIAPYFDMKRSTFRNGLKHIECELLFNKYYEL